jgi:hypothetical protein
LERKKRERDVTDPLLYMWEDPWKLDRGMGALSSGNEARKGGGRKLVTIF